MKKILKSRLLPNAWNVSNARNITKKFKCEKKNFFGNLNSPHLLKYIKCETFLLRVGLLISEKCNNQKKSENYCQQGDAAG